MADVSIEPVRELRRPVQEGLRQLVRAAEAVLAGDEEALARLDEVMAYLEHDLFPHLVAEEWVIFTAVDGAFGQVGTAHIMAAFHDQLRAMALDLQKVVRAARQAGEVGPYRRYLLPLLYGLYGAARAHFGAEDDSYLPFLESKLSEPQVEAMVENLERVAEEARQAGKAPAAP